MSSGQNHPVVEILDENSGNLELLGDSFLKVHTEKLENENEVLTMINIKLQEILNVEIKSIDELNEKTKTVMKLSTILKISIFDCINAFEMIREHQNGIINHIKSLEDNRKLCEDKMRKFCLSYRSVSQKVNQKISALTKKNIAYEKENTELRSEMNELKKQVEAYKVYKKRVEAQIESESNITEENSSLKKENESVKVTVQNLQQEILQLNKKNKSAMKDVNDLTGKINKHSAELVAKSNQIDALNKNLNKAKQENEALTNKISMINLQKITEISSEKKISLQLSEQIKLLREENNNLRVKSIERKRSNGKRNTWDITSESESEKFVTPKNNFSFKYLKMPKRKANQNENESDATTPKQRKRNFSSDTITYTPATNDDSVNSTIMETISINQ